MSNLTPEQMNKLERLESQEARRKAYHKKYNANKSAEQKAREKEYHRQYNARQREELNRLRQLAAEQ